MKYFAGIFFLLTLGCSNRHGPLAIFKKLSPHDQYGQHLADAGLANSALGRSWQTKAQAVLGAPLAISLPYRETGYFPADRAEATAFVFTAKRGQKITVQLFNKPSVFVIYTDLFFGGELVSSSESSGMSFEVRKAGNFILRLQPELLQAGQYTLTVTLSPALGFPVSASGHPKIEGYWGDGRDDNSRKHEGIDIFAPKGTPALAATNGTVVQVSENKLGGLVVMMEPQGRDYTLYYAHLGTQLVHTGQQVREGDTLGTIDNTGNAKTTPSHLHFGIYTSEGAIDPLLFVKPVHQLLWPATADLERLNTYGTLNDMPVRILAATHDQYKISDPGNEVSIVVARSVKPMANKPLVFNRVISIYDQPDTTAARMIQVQSGKQVCIRGSYQNYKLVSYSNFTGWIYDKK